MKLNTCLNVLAAKLRIHGRHSMISYLSSLPIAVFRSFDTEANRITIELIKCTMLLCVEARCYTQHALRPFIVRLYRLHRLHKRSYKARFIANSSSCNTTELSKLSASCPTAIKSHAIRNCEAVYDFSSLYTTLPHNLIKEKLLDLIQWT